MGDNGTETKKMFNFQLKFDKNKVKSAGWRNSITPKKPKGKISVHDTSVLVNELTPAAIKNNKSKIQKTRPEKSKKSSKQKSNKDDLEKSFSELAVNEKVNTHSPPTSPSDSKIRKSHSDSDEMPTDHDKKRQKLSDSIHSARNDVFSDIFNNFRVFS